jgi:hypothetical protein
MKIRLVDLFDTPGIENRYYRVSMVRGIHLPHLSIDLPDECLIRQVDARGRQMCRSGTRGLARRLLLAAAESPYSVLVEVKDEVDS